MAYSASVNSLDGRGRAPLYGACTHTHRTQLAMVLIEAAADVNLQDRDGNTPLHAAVMYNRRDIVEFLLALGCDVNTAGEQGFTPLHIATKFNYPELVELLLRAGARTDMITRDEKTARDLAVWGRDRSTEQMGDILQVRFQIPERQQTRDDQSPAPGEKGDRGSGRKLERKRKKR